MIIFLISFISSDKETTLASIQDESGRIRRLVDKENHIENRLNWKKYILINLVFKIMKLGLF